MNETTLEVPLDAFTLLDVLSLARVVLGRPMDIEREGTAISMLGDSALCSPRKRRLFSIPTASIDRILSPN